TPAHMAAKNGDVDIFRLLIFYADTELKTPLDLAQEASHAETVALLKLGITKRLRRNFNVA
ncbi:MAG: ankyrin repeat domain-containing protein, partial [Anaerolineales bacterium]